MNKYDEEAIKKVDAYLTSKGYTTYITPNEYDHFDIIIKTPKGNIAVEVKGRNVPSYQYPNMACEIAKINAARCGVAEGEFKDAILACTYTDGVLGLGYLMKGHSVLAEGPATTYFDRTERRIKYYWDVDFACRVKLD